MHSETQVKLVNIFLNDELFFGTGDIEYFKETKVDYLYDIVNNGQVTYNGNSETQYAYKLTYIEERMNIIGGEIIYNKDYPQINHHFSLLDCNEAYRAQGINFTSKFDKNNVYGADTSGTNEMECFPMIVLVPGADLLFPNDMYLLIKPGVYVLQYHLELAYTNGNNVYNDTSGISLFVTNNYDISNVSNASISNANSNGQRMGLGTMVGFGASTNVTLEPGTNNYQVSFVISSDCTNKLLTSPIDMVMMIAHMHDWGETFKAERIRNGISETIYSIKKWDFDRHFATPTYATILPNDTIRFTCSYSVGSHESDAVRFQSALTDQTTQSEMCAFVFGYVPWLPDFEFAASDILTENDKDGTVYGPSYCGSYPTWSVINRMLVMSVDEAANYTNMYQNSVNIKKNDENVNFKDNNQICKTSITSITGLIDSDLVYSFNIPFISLGSCTIILVILLIMSSVVHTTLVTYSGVYKLELDLINQRRVVVYLMSIMFCVVLLVMSSISFNCIAIKNNECNAVYSQYNLDNVIKNCPIVEAGSIMVIFYIWEIIYRIQLKWHLIVHHFLAILIAFCLFSICQFTLSAFLAMRITVWYLFQLGLEFPVFISLLIFRLKIKQFNIHIEKLMYFCGIWNFITKIVTTIFVIVWFLDDYLNDSYKYCSNYVFKVSYAQFLSQNGYVSKNIDEILNGCYLTLCCILFLLQMYQGYSLIVFGQKVGKQKKTDIMMQMGTTNSPSVIDTPRGIDTPYSAETPRDTN